VLKAERQMSLREMLTPFWRLDPETPADSNFIVRALVEHNVLALG
jgi:hypothetical protein